MVELKKQSNGNSKRQQNRAAGGEAEGIARKGGRAPKKRVSLQIPRSREKEGTQSEQVHIILQYEILVLN